jgi:hypothetical protein
MRSAIDNKRRRVEVGDVTAALPRAIAKTQQSILSDYVRATTSPRKESLYPQVLLSCALARKDELGFFAPADIRSPMTAIMRKRYEIPSFIRHLNDFALAERGAVLRKVGPPRRYRLRFNNPLMQPYVVMQGLASGMVDQRTVDRLSR